MTSPVADIKKFALKEQSDIEMHPREPSEIDLNLYESKPTTFEVTPTGQLRSFSVKNATAAATGAINDALAASILA